MTKEEAIERLKLTDACDVNLCEALDMAIKALEQQSTVVLNEIKEEIKNCIVHSPYFHTTSDCCHVRDDVMQIFDKHITKIEEDKE